MQGLAEDARKWSEGAHRNAVGLATALGLPAERYAEDALLLMPALQNYVDLLPLGEFEKEDWIALHTDLTSYLGDVLVRRWGAAWGKVEDPDSPVGHRYVVEATGLDNAVHQVEPYDVVMEEFENPPIGIGRMLANAEAVLHVTPTTNGPAHTTP
ncbi:hypothetical protein [Streptomyces tremellae]|uniref:Uncharacterized protein n=1 Tax=Streptomyces tremellae TaxID=1124239 RepID=A0ABP7EWC2_9ACTN